MIHMLHRVVELLEQDQAKGQILVIGDLMLDRYIWGDVERISPEAPVPVVRTVNMTEQPGGAANVATNVAGLATRVKLLGFCGDDENGKSLKSHLVDAGVDADLTVVPTHPTTTKLRILGGRQQML